jgi:hypothetical protein
LEISAEKREHFVCLPVVATGFLICSLILLCCPFYESRFSKQTTIATSSLHARWIYFNVHPVDMVTMDPDHFPLNLDLLFWKKKYNLFALHTYILLQLYCHYCGVRFHKQTVTAISYLHDKWLSFNAHPMKMLLFYWLRVSIGKECIVPIHFCYALTAIRYSSISKQSLLHIPGMTGGLIWTYT